MKKIIAVLLCGALALNGCAMQRATTGKCKTESRWHREYEEVKRSLRTTTEKGLKYRIGGDQVSFRGYSLTVPISKCEVEREFYLEEVVPMAEYREDSGCEVETWTSLDRRKKWRTGLGWALGLAGGVAGALAASNRVEPQGPRGHWVVIACLAGVTVGGLIGVALGRSIREPEYEIQWTSGETRTEPIGKPTTRVDGLKGETELACVPAPDVAVRVTSDHFVFWDVGGGQSSDALLHSGPDGILNVSIAASPKTWGVDSDHLLQKVSSWEVFGYIKSSAVDPIKSLLVDEMYDSSLPVKLKTAGSPSGEYKEVYNDEKTVHVQGKTLNEESAVYSAMESFIDQRINSHVKTVVIETKDYDSHVALSSGNIEASIASPPPYRLVRDYFKEPLMEWAIQRVSYYERGEVGKTFGDDGRVFFTVYVPCDVQVKITHSKYHYVQESLHFGEDKLDKTIYMSELGQKMRVRIVDH